MQVRERMSRNPSYCFEDEEIAEVARKMGQLTVPRLPVLDRTGRLVGVISGDDLSQVGGSSGSQGDRDETAARDFDTAAVGPGRKIEFEEDAAVRGSSSDADQNRR